MSGLTCEAFVELVTNYLDGALGPDAENGFVEHLVGCGGCMRYLDQMRWVIESLHANGGIGPSKRSVRQHRCGATFGEFVQSPRGLPVQTRQ